MMSAIVLEGDQLNAARSDILEPDITLKERQAVLDGIAPYAHSDPEEVGARFYRAQ